MPKLRLDGATMHTLRALCKQVRPRMSAVAIARVVGCRGITSYMGRRFATVWEVVQQAQRGDHKLGPNPSYWFNMFLDFC